MTEFKIINFEEFNSKFMRLPDSVLLYRCATKTLHYHGNRYNDITEIFDHFSKQDLEIVLMNLDQIRRL